MSLFFSYLLKLSVSLAAVYLFYRIVLRRLTFYNWNRFYLIGYTLLSFFIPFLNITAMLERNEISGNKMIQLIPIVGNFGDSVVKKMPLKEHVSTWSPQQWLLLLLVTGIVALAIRLIIQLLSFLRIIRTANLVSDNEIKLYQVDKKIIPFSFGNAIFINREMHTVAELTDIFRHEFVHVRQLHTMDIIWSEILCMLNWYNPFAWLIRSAVRQNLEFIADQKVLQTGIDKKQYQYLLLKVLGNNHFSMANQFNFSSLKKRIIMMNKLKSAGLHAVKFVFILPLIALLILSFREKIKAPAPRNNEHLLSLSGLVIDHSTQLPLTDVLIYVTKTGFQTKTDSKGFFTLSLPMSKSEKQEVNLKLFKTGFQDNERRLEIYPDLKDNWSAIGFFGLIQDGNKNVNDNYILFYASKDKTGKNLTNPGYDLVKDKFENYFKPHKTDESSLKLKVFTVEDLHLEELGRNTASLDVNNRSRQELRDSLPSDVLTVLDGEELRSGTDIKGLINDNDIEAVTIFKAKDALAMYGDQGKNGVVVITSKKFASKKVSLMSDTMMFKDDFKKRTILNVLADTITWSAVNNKLFFKGNVTINDGLNHFDAKSKFAIIGEAGQYVLLDGADMIRDKNYVNAPGRSYWVVALTKEKATQKYGNKGRLGAIEITSRDY